VGEHGRLTGTGAAVADLRDSIAQLVDSSRRNYANPYDDVGGWPAAVEPGRDWFFTPELSSLWGSALWDDLDEPARRRACFFEACNFFSLNIHGERHLVRGVTERLYRPDMAEAAPYFHAFVDEENKHSLYFGTFCARYGRVYRSRHPNQAPSLASGGAGAGGGPAGSVADRNADDDLRFFAKVLLFEEISDRYNVAQGKDERLHPVARFINRRHHADETRHLIFGRRLVKALWQAHAPRWSAEQVDDLRRYLDQYLLVVWRDYYNPEVYRDAGFDAPWDVADALWDSEPQRQRRRAFTRRAVRPLVECGLLTEEPHVVC
jgi:hypothetical protein